MSFDKLFESTPSRQRLNEASLSHHIGSAVDSAAGAADSIKYVLDQLRRTQKNADPGGHVQRRLEPLLSQQLRIYKDLEKLEKDVFAAEGT